jgi:hypothetical protein
MLSVRFIKQFAALGILLTLAIGCTRPKSNTSSIQILIPTTMSSQKVGSQSTELLAHVVINVSGPGIAEPILFEWSNRGPDDQPNPNPPSSFVLDVPQGDGRLIQVLTVYLNDDNGQMSFYYGDASKALKAADESVVVAVSSIGQGETIISGQISGRYFTAPNAGPTGKVFVKFKPSVDKPSLILEKSRIMNGWFSFFAMQGAKFEYVMDNGKVLFGGPVNLADAQFNPNTSNSKLLRVTLPLSNRNESWNPGTPDWQTEEPMISVFGWFSDPGQEATTSGKVICRPASPIALTRMGQFQQAVPTIARTLLTPAVNQTVPIASALYNINSPLPNYYINGGVDHTNASCSPDASNYLSFMRFKEFMVDGNGKDSAVPFRAPFRLLPPTNGSTEERPLNFTSPTAGTMRVSGQLLPGLLPMIDRFIAYKRIGPDFSGDSDRLMCPMIASGAHGFTQAGQVNLSNDSFDLDFPLTTAEITQQANVVICAAKGDLIYDSAVLIRSDMWGMGGGGGGGGPTNPPNGFRLNFAKESYSSKVLANFCYSSGIELTFNNNSNGVGNTSNRTFTLGGSVNGFTGAVSWYHNIADCTSQINSQTTVTVNTGTNFSPLYFRVTESGGLDVSPSMADNISLNANTADTATFTMNSTASTNYSIASPAGHNGIKWSMGWIEMGSNDCRMVSIFAVDTAGFPVVLAGTVSVNLPGITGGGFYSDCSSNTAISSIPIASGSFVSHLAVKSTPTITNQSVDASIPSPSANDTLIINPPKAYDRLEAFFLAGLPTVMFKSECYAIQARGIDISGNAILNSIGIPVPIRFQNYGGPNSGSYYNSPSCSGGSTGSYDSNIAHNNMNSPSVYFKYGNGAINSASIVMDGYNPYLTSGFNNSSLNLPPPSDDPFSIFNSLTNWYLKPNVYHSTPNWTAVFGASTTTSNVSNGSESSVNVADLNSTSSYINIPGTYNGPFTIAFPFYLSSVPGAAANILKFNISGDTIEIKIETNGDLMFYRNSSPIHTIGTSVSVGWHKFILSRDVNVTPDGAFFVGIDSSFVFTNWYASDDSSINTIILGDNTNSAAFKVPEVFTADEAAVTLTGTSGTAGVGSTVKKDLIMNNTNGYFKKRYPSLFP